MFQATPCLPDRMQSVGLCARLVQSKGCPLLPGLLLGSARASDVHVLTEHENEGAYAPSLGSKQPGGHQALLNTQTGGSCQ